MNKKALGISLKIAIVLAVIIAFFVINAQIDDNRKKSFHEIDDNNQYGYEVESIYEDGDFLCIKGWFIEYKKIRNEEVETNEKDNLGILLIDANAKNDKNVDGTPKLYEGIICEVQRESRQDINAYYKCEYDYSGCGFVAKIPKNKLDIEKNDYRVVFKPNVNSLDGLIASAYIYNGKLSREKKDNYKEPEVAGTALEDIVSRGTLLAASKEHHYWIYQNDWKLYIIAEDGFAFDNGKTFIQYSVDTTQFDKLPSDRTEQGWYWSNLFCYFEEYEITNLINCGEYRVMCREIPSEYSVTVIGIGRVSEGEWLWGRTIRPSLLKK